MEYNSSLVSWFFVLLALVFSLSYVSIQLAQPAPTPPAVTPPPTTPPPAVTPPTQTSFAMEGTYQNWQCNDTQSCYDVFNNQGLPFTSDNKPIIQQKQLGQPVWKCDEKGCVDVFNFVGPAF